MFPREFKCHFPVRLIQERFYGSLPTNAKGEGAGSSLAVRGGAKLLPEPAVSLPRLPQDAQGCSQHPKTWSKQPAGPDKNHGQRERRDHIVTRERGPGPRPESGLAAPLANCVTLASGFLHCMCEMGMMICIFGWSSSRKRP